MDRLEFQPTTKTPYILLDPKGTIKFSGRSIPEDVTQFYQEVLDWVRLYSDRAVSPTLVDIEMEYLNSGTSKFLMKILKVFKEIGESGVELKVNWKYEEGDDDILERGEYYASILDLPINLIEID